MQQSLITTEGKALLSMPPTQSSVARRKTLTRMEENSNRAMAALARIELDFGNFDKEHPPERLIRIRAAVDEYLLAQQAYEKGHSALAIAKVLGRKNINAWFNGALPNELLRADPQFRKQASIPVTIPVSPSEDFSYILGVYAAVAQKGKHLTPLTVRHQNKEVIEELLSHAATIIDHASPPRISQNTKEEFVVRLGGVELRRHLGLLTNNNTRLAWRYLISKKEQTAFLKGFFSFAGGTFLQDTITFRLCRHDNEELIQHIAVLLCKRGLYPSVLGAPHATVAFVDANEVEKAFILKILPDHTGEMKRVLHSRRRREITPEEYFRTMELLTRVKAPSAYAAAKYVSAEIGREISDDTLKLWSNGETPFSVKRLHKLLALEVKVLSHERSTISAELLRRYQHSRHSVHAFIQDVCAWEGGTLLLSQKLGVPLSKLQAILSGETPISAEELQTIVARYDLNDLAPSFCEVDKSLESQVALWCSQANAAKYNEKFSNLLLTVAHHALRIEEDPRLAVLSEIARLKRQQR